MSQFETRAHGRDRPKARAVLATAVSLLKLRIGIAIAASAVAGAAAAQGAAREAWEVLALALAVLGASGAAGAFNHYYERDLDRHMHRTAARPFASGMLRPGAGWLAAFAALAVLSLALAYAVGGAVSAVYVLLGGFTYGVVYTVWLKRRTPVNIVVGGLSGSFAVLAGAAAVDPMPQTVPVLLALVLFLWTPPHFWALAAARRDDYANAGFPMLPVVAPERVWTTAILAHTVALTALSLLPLWFGMGLIYGIGAGLGGAVFVWRSWRLYRQPCRKTAMATFGASLIHLTLLTLAVVLDAAVVTKAAATPAAGPLDPRAVLERSEAAIGTRLGDHTLRDPQGRPIALADYRGRPLVISLVYSSCSTTCPVTTQHLIDAVAQARKSLGADRFAVLTIGFDARHDSPQRMAAFAGRQGIPASGWDVASGDEATLAALMHELGFTYQAAAGGFDHVALTTIVDAEGRIHRQVYGDDFPLPVFIEPLKETVFGITTRALTVPALLDRLSFLCTVYDPGQGRYRTSYAIALGIGIGALSLAISGIIFVRAWRRNNRLAASRRAPPPRQLIGRRT
ncbi:MAG: heme o synthase [Xanthobacteraceae bacterium]|nr:heme o synthase [Xanthobacteraceae bacterium]